MQALLAAYDSSSDGSDGNDKEEKIATTQQEKQQEIVVVGGGAGGGAGAGGAAASTALPPPPQFVLDTRHAKRKRETESRAKHGGRKRQFPHIEGNFPAIVFISRMFVCVCSPSSSCERCLTHTRMVQLHLQRSWPQCQSIVCSVLVAC